MKKNPDDTTDDDDEERDSANDEADERADEEDDSRRPSKRESKRSTRSGKRERPARKAAAVVTEPGASLTMPRALLLAAVTLIAGVALGWGLRDRRAEQETSGAAEVAAGSTPCDTWKDEVCKGTSPESAACSGAKATAGILPAAACNAGLADMPATLDRIKAARASCDKLVTKLCADLGKESSGCQLVTAKTPSIPPEGCEEMLGKYDEVLAQLQMIGQPPPGMPGMMGPGGPPPGMRGGPGAPPPGMRPPSKPGAP